MEYGRVVSYFVSTSNHNRALKTENKMFVVSYFVSTSNHNGVALQHHIHSVVSYFVSTSNHNLGLFSWLFPISYAKFKANKKGSKATKKCV